MTVTHLHQDPNSLRTNVNVNEFVTVLLSQAPPTRLHKPTINLSPTFHHLQQLPHTTCSSSQLQAKLAFLLGVTCFLRPSDLQRIPYRSIQVSPNSASLYFEVHAPKEKRNRRLIIKSFTVKAHVQVSLCPIAVFLTLRARRPVNLRQDALFLNSVDSSVPLQTRTISG
ncbi:hypothetical protein G6F46_012854 [Rhizopus delemar]|uniref:Uncharacterized protein n=2 Tax=Rhizopus TaxID=4842 RepID=A0A9P7CI80_9FUNG|nr:hypothetical protein G6F55_012746 [Rhizopus delemar]KAG1532643.1 hypothetical protein G6F51_013008 [Rhizopus arrhizus]KAG1487090.1 hypothetical protein G6F54_012880 [Rhizopus delemar]KAG1492862.1 hypothetical protein G6F53_012862 [Rhizopus delemar]KAG1499243.1 hypothetical protein G6F52_012681 [Rhizopus delemar]